MPQEYLDRIRALPTAKALAIGLYGESVASYRYRILSEKAASELHRSTFLGMAEEEQGHHHMLQRLLDQHFPGSDFVLSPQDKELIIVGERMLDVSDGPAIDRALEQIYDSEQRTGQFYAALRDTITLTELKPLLTEMAEECFEHAQQLKDLGPASWDRKSVV